MWPQKPGRNSLQTSRVAFVWLKGLGKSSVGSHRDGRSTIPLPITTLGPSHQSPQLYPHYPVGHHREHIITENNLFFFYKPEDICIIQWSGFRLLPRPESPHREGWQALGQAPAEAPRGWKCHSSFAGTANTGCAQGLTQEQSARHLGERCDRSEWFRNWCNLLFWHPKSMIHNSNMVRADLGCLDVPVSQKEARLPLVCGKKGEKWRRGGIRRKGSTSCR